MALMKSIMKLRVLILGFCLSMLTRIDTHAAIISAQADSIVVKSVNSYKEPGKRKIRRLRGKNQVKNLKSGILLIRLKTDANRIAAFEKKGQPEKAEQVRIFRRESNLRIVNAFRQNYKYSDIMFFYNTDSEKLINRQYKGIFLDDNLDIDPDIKLDTARFWLIGELDVLEADTAKHRESTYWNPATKKLEYTYWSSSSDFSRRALVIRDQNFIQLKRPFPYYVSCRNEDIDDPLLKEKSTVIKRSVDEAVVILDMKLHRKYKRYSRIK